MKDARVSLDVGLHIPRRHQTNLVTKLRKFTRPIMGGGARLHADKARRQRLEELQHLAAPKSLPNDDLLGRVDPVNLNTCLAISKPIVATCVAGAGTVHHIRKRLMHCSKLVRFCRRSFRQTLHQPSVSRLATLAAIAGRGPRLDFSDWRAG